jgi:hypothetical protein
MGVIWRQGICSGFCTGFFDSSRTQELPIHMPNRIKQCILHLLNLAVPSRRTVTNPGYFLRVKDTPAGAERTVRRVLP